MLGLRASPKEDLNVSTAEVLYGAAITWNVPAPPSGIPLRPRSYAEEARDPLENLLRASYKYVRRGHVVGLLKPAYDGPYRVLSKEAKVFRLLVGDKEESVSMDRLKPHVAEK
jgi:hypothetical protein